MLCVYLMDFLNKLLDLLFIYITINLIDTLLKFSILIFKLNNL
jgi:hypothetical protein